MNQLKKTNNCLLKKSILCQKILEMNLQEKLVLILRVMSLVIKFD